ncbi:unnamed protein product [Rotaria sordida]|uniref:Uncharacterized protein n=1 Tax=Rotaria sordida TaxID=392033 RepID=A0A814TTF2_9BILA|nr:unnamed protein product [Rotaria sordida]
MDINEDIQELEEEEEENISPIIQIFECLTFERGHQIHDQVTSMIDLFSLSNMIMIVSMSVLPFLNTVTTSEALNE